MVHLSYDYNWVIGSVLVAIAACYLAVYTEQRIFSSKEMKRKLVWVFTGGLVIGVGIWSMHFMGMLACQMPVDISFEPILSIISLLIAVSAATFSLWLTTYETLPLARLILGSVLRGLGIAGMHYTGMASIQSEAVIQYDYLVVALSILFGICASGSALWLGFKLRHRFESSFVARFVVAVVMGLSIVGVHYIAMEATQIHYMGHLGHSMMTSNYGVTALTIIFISCAFFFAFFAVSMLEIKLEQRSILLEQANKKLANIALHDNLTRLPNRLYLDDYAKMVIAKHRQGNEKFALMFIDLDGFKAINDAFGHQIGDELLLTVVNRLEKYKDDNNVLFRIGGDEFLLVKHQTYAEQALHFSEELLEVLSEPYVLSSREISISASIGVAIYPDHGTNIQDLLINADAAMYQAKDQGRNSSSIFSYSMNYESQMQIKLLNDLYHAIDDRQLVLFYQPKFMAKGREICGTEALIRWNHPTLGLLTPNKFIDVAEKTGIIVPIGYWVIQEACRQIGIWTKQYGHSYPVSINLSALQFEHPQLLDKITEALHDFKVDPSLLVIEITESTAMRHIEKSIRTFQELQKIGVKIAIDDFGTGHSSFLYLKDLPVDELKIDRGFLTNLHPKSKEEIILSSIVNLASRLELSVTAEGVENIEQADILTTLGCDQLQGFLLGRPVEAYKIKFDQNDVNA